MKVVIFSEGPTRITVGGPFLALIVAMVLVGCAASTVEYVPYETKVPIPVPCAAETPPAPVRATKDLRAADTLDDKTKALLSDLKGQEGYIEKLKAATAGCR